MWKKTVLQVLWSLAGIGVILLLGTSFRKKTNKHCRDVKIEIRTAEKEVFINENEVLQLINCNGNVIDKSLSEIDLKDLEKGIKKNLWIKDAEMFFDNNQLLHIDIEERTPIARVFTRQGNSYYIDSSALRLPLSEKLSARVPVFTNFPSDKNILSQSDSMILTGIVKFGKYILADSFWTAQVSQIDITQQATFEMIPSIGDQIIDLGNADNIDSKFKRLFTFYKKAWMQNGINKYEKLDVQYDGQIVAVKRGKESRMRDSINNSDSMNRVFPQINSTEGQTLKMDLNKLLPKVPVGPMDPVSTNKAEPKKNRDVIKVKQNKAINKSLSVSHKANTETKFEEKNTQPKAVMKKN
jgi:cell division protein FtsQ